VAVPHRDDAVGELRHVRLVRHEDDGEPPLAVERPDRRDVAGHDGAVDG
jgi:hypothetical protein